MNSLKGLIKSLMFHAILLTIIIAQPEHGYSELLEIKSLYLFISADCAYSREAIQIALRFKGKHPEIELKGYLLTPMKEIMKSNIPEFFTDRIRFEISPEMAKKFSITYVPSFVFSSRKGIIKIAGQPDLDEAFGFK